VFDLTAPVGLAPFVAKGNFELVFSFSVSVGPWVMIAVIELSQKYSARKQPARGVPRSRARFAIMPISHVV
jgi:hypothetical protein